MISIDLFRNEGRFQSFPRESVVFAEGERGDTMYVVLEGSVDLLIRGKTVESLGPGGLLGEMTMIDGSPRVATAIARTDSKLVPIDERRFNFLIQQTPHFALQVMRVLADRLRRMDDKL
jgi:CRP/FNR family cyclic AMP-dependent transcriptional regulator